MKEFGRYTVIEEIGHGAMGAVYKAHDPIVERVVAIKTILAAALAGPQAEEYRERFKREARAAGRLSHPGVVTVYDVGVQEGTPYLVMEFVPSRTLETALLGGNRFTLERTYEIGQQLGTALAYAHKNGVIHRDIKPANILLTLEAPERAKITDFGVAKLSASQATSTGALLGTPAFMAPEQFTGAGIDGRSDLFSLGVVLYSMATGDKPFAGETITAVSYQIVHTEPISPRALNPAISPAFESVILKCLQKDPAKRYQSGELLAQDLGNLREGRTGPGQISAMSATASPESDPAATVPLAGKTASVRLAGNQETQALGLAEQIERISAPGGAGSTFPPSGPVSAGSSAASTSIRAEMKATAASAKSGEAIAPPAPLRGTGSSGSRRDGAGLKPAPWPPPRPRSGGSGRWMAAAAILLILAILWGASVVKRKKEEATAAANLAAQQGAAQRDAAAKLKAASAASVAAENKETATQALAEEHAVKTAATHDPLPQPRGQPKIEKVRESAEPPLPDVSHYALRLEVDAIASATVEIQPDDRAGVSRLLKAGHKILVGADKVLLLRTDNAGALRLKMNEQELAMLGPLGAPRTTRLTVRDLKSPTVNTASNSVAGGKRVPVANAAEATSPARATRVPQSGPATIQIAVPNMPNFADIIVWVDDKPIFHQKRIGNAGFGRISEQRQVLPGTHTLRVYLGNLDSKTGMQRRISGDFAMNQAKTLRVDTRFRGMPHDASQLGFSLTLE